MSAQSWNTGGCRGEEGQEGGESSSSSTCKRSRKTQNTDANEHTVSRARVYKRRAPAALSRPLWGKPPASHAVSWGWVSRQGYLKIVSGPFLPQLGSQCTCQANPEFPIWPSVCSLVPGVPRPAEDMARLNKPGSVPGREMQEQGVGLLLFHQGLAAE